MADAAKVEAQRRETQPRGRFGGAKDNFVMKGAAKLRVRVTHQRHHARIDRRVPLEQRFEPSNRARDKESFEFRTHVLVLQEAVGAPREAGRAKRESNAIVYNDSQGAAWKPRRRGVKEL